MRHKQFLTFPPLALTGIICGQVLVGFEGDWVGRKFGLVQDAAISASPSLPSVSRFGAWTYPDSVFAVFLGLVMLTASWGTSLEGWVVSLHRSQALGGGGKVES